MIYLINPVNNKKISLFSLQGKHLLKQYIKTFLGGVAAAAATNPCNTESSVIYDKDTYNNKMVRKKLKIKKKTKPVGKKYSILIGAGNINLNQHIMDCNRAREANIDISITNNRKYINDNETKPYSLLLNLNDSIDLEFLNTHFKNKIERIIFDKSTVKFFLPSSYDAMVKSLDEHNPKFEHFIFGFINDFSYKTYEDVANIFGKLIDNSTQPNTPAAGEVEKTLLSIFPI